MRRGWIFGFVCLLMVSLITNFQAQPVRAQSEAAPTDKVQGKKKTPGDKRTGEEEEILKREEWFRKMRGLDELYRPNELRKRAIEELKGKLALQQDLVPSTWFELGPSPMNNFTGWVMGRVAGRVSALAVDPTNESVLYLGTASGGLWKTSDGGTLWTPVFDGVGTETIGSVAIDPNDPAIIWVGTGEQGRSCVDYFGMGVFRSLDGALSFAARNGTGGATVDLALVTAVAVQPGNSNLVLAGGRGSCYGVGAGSGLYRTTDAGATWSRVLAGTEVGDVLFDPTAPNIAYAAVTGGGVYKSTDAGATWGLLTNGITSGASVLRVRLAMAPSNSNILYAVVHRSAGTPGLYRTLDGGALWQERSSSACDGQCDYNLSLNVSPASADTLLVGAIRPYRSTDGGTTLTVLTNTWGVSQQVHQDTHVVRYSQTDSNRFWVGSDGGLWRTEDNGVSYANLNTGLNVTQFYDIAVHPTDAGRIFGGAQDNSSEARSASPIWDVTVITGDGFVNAVDPGNTSYVFTESYPDSSGPNIYRSTNGGGVGSFGLLPKTGITLGASSFPWKTELGVLQSTSTMYLLTGSTHMYRVNARAGTVSWTRVSNDLGGVVSGFGPALGGTLYVGTSSGKVWRSDNTLSGAPTFLDVTGNLPVGTVSDIAIDPNYRWRVFVTRSVFGGSKLYRSDTGGTTWTAVGSGLPDVPANTVAIDPVNRQRVFVGTDIGVYVSENDGYNFDPQMGGLPLGVVIMDLEVDDSPHVLTAGTYGRGAWQLALPNESRPCIPANGVDDTNSVTNCCTGIAMNGTTVCLNPADYNNGWASCSHICASHSSNDCIPSGGLDDYKKNRRCCSNNVVPNSLWCLDPADWGTDWVSCVQTCV